MKPENRTGEKRPPACQHSQQDPSPVRLRPLRESSYASLILRNEPRPVQLRPHHLLCLQNFRGKGYSPAFVQRMTEIRRLLLPGSAESPAPAAQGQDTEEDHHVQRPDSETDVLAQRPDSETGALAQRPDSETGALAPSILLVSGPDDLCVYCPNCENGHCTSLKPAEFDRLVLAHTGLTAGELLPKGLRSAKISKMNADLLKACCPGCDWLPLCLDIQERTRKQKNGKNKSEKHLQSQKKNAKLL